MNDRIEMPNDFTEGQEALIEKISYKVAKAYSAEHARERELAMEAWTMKMLTEVRAMVTDHADTCPALKQAGRLRTWAPVALGTFIGVLIGAGLLKIEVILTWISRLVNGA